jgi:hypothetical protein
MPETAETLSLSDPSVLAAAEQLLEREHAESTLSPFGMTEDHEFGTHHSVESHAEPDEPVPDAPAFPGSPDSIYRRCACLGVMPGRVCSFCYGTKWTKICSKCSGEGRVDLNIRKGAERSQPCGFCGGKGILPANQAEILRAIKEAEDYIAENGQTIIAVDAPEYRRAVRLPGIGATPTKGLKPTLAGRRKEKTRLAKRTQLRKASKSAQA